MQSGSQIAVPGISLNTRDLPAQGIAYLQSCFKQTVHMIAWLQYAPQHVN
jgi:hypothetical protein